MPLISITNLFTFSLLLCYCCCCAWCVHGAHECHGCGWRLEDSCVESLPGRKRRLSDVCVTNSLSPELYAQPSSLIFKVLYLLRIAESVLDAGVVCTCPCACETQSTTLWSRISSSTRTWLLECKCKRLRLVQQAPLPTRQLSGLFSLHNVAGISESCRWFLCFLAINVLSQLLQPEMTLVSAPRLQVPAKCRFRGLS